MAANTLELALRTVKKYYEKIDGQMQAGKIGLDKFLFGIDDMDTSGQFAIDSFVLNPHGVSFRKAGEQSHVRKFDTGTGKVYEVPRISEKTPITEYDQDLIVAGLEATSGQAQNAARRVEKIVQTHKAAHYMTRVKYALDTMRTGAFSPLGIEGQDIGLEIDFSQSGDNDITYDFTDADASMNTALQEMFEVYRANGGNLSDVTVIFGSDWYNNFFEDTDVLTWMDSNSSNILLEQSMNITNFANVDGLYKMATYRPGIVASLNLCQVSFGHKFTPYLGGTAVDFFPSDEAIMFSPSAERYRVFRGIDAVDNGRIQKVVGELVFDSFIENDPVQEYIRTQTRLAMIPANVNQIVRSTGTFTEES